MKSAVFSAAVFLAAMGLAARVSAQTDVGEGTFKNAKGEKIGTVHIEHMTSATLFLIKVHDLPPGVHGIHIHSVGKCEPPDFTSAGPHFNPANAKHGFKNPAGPHAGDLPNITVGPDGKVETQFVVSGARQWEGEGGLLDGDGASLVIHAGPDDYTTDPAGNSGARIACASISLPERQE